MKQKIYILGIINAMILVAGAMFKANHWPAAGILLTAGIISMLALFLPAALINHYRASGNSEARWLYVITYITCLVVFTAMLLKIMHWPYAGIMLFISLPFPFVVFLPAWLYYTSRIRNFDINNTVFVLFLLAVQAVFSVLLSLGVSKERIENTLQVSSLLNTQNTMTKALPFPSGTKLASSAGEVLLQINQCREMFYEKAGKAGGRMEDVNVRYMDSRNIAARLFNSDGSSTRAVKLESSIRQFAGDLKALPEFKGMNAKIDDIFGIYSSGENMGWTQSMFVGNYFTWNMADLDALENAVRVIMNSIVD